MSEQNEYNYENQRMPDRLPDPPRDRDAWWKSFLRRGRLDVPFLLLTILLLTVGVIMLFSASYADAYYTTLQKTGVPNPTLYFRKQLRFAIAGTIAALLISLFPLKWLRKKFIALLAIAAVVSLLGFVVVRGSSANGAERWAAVGEQGFQPSELVKAAVVVIFAYWIYADGKKIEKFRALGKYILLLIVIAALLLMQPHLSATVIILMLGTLMLFAGGARWYWFLLIGGVVTAGMLFLHLRSEDVVMWIDQIPDDQSLAYMLRRISVWLDPEAKKLDGGWQILQSLYAIGSGGLLGLGLGNSRQKYMYLPEEQNDYIFPIVCEELGFVGAALILLLFAVLIIRGFWLGIHCKERFEKMIIIGYTGLLAIQVFLNVGVVTNMLPSTGISLPFFSSGGTALLVQMGEVGLILSASRSVQDK